ncbi:MAG TPA: thiamine phosphate synthase, partial [Cytophagaceae bacterium]|nr:thiamine phosphate synthase [Cytophagaceae bacterium]
MNKISKLHYITQDDIFGYTHAQLAEEACMGGAEWVQLRVKKKGYNEWKEIAEDVQKICKKYKAKLIINDNVRIAKEISADGVHLGKSDLSATDARKILGEGFIIGGTANDFMDIENLAAEKVDYIGLGPFRFTSTKENLSPVLGLKGYKKIMQACKEIKLNIPIVAIGGILIEDIKDILSTDIYGVAISSGINMAED